MCLHNKKISASSIDRLLKKYGLPRLNEKISLGQTKAKGTITSTNIGPVAKLTDEYIAVELVAKAGFDAWDFSMTGNALPYNWKTGTIEIDRHPFTGSNYMSFARELKKIGEDNGIYCNQSHAPFPTHITGMDSYLKRALECTAEAGGKFCVIHPVNDWNTEQNAEMFFDLLPFAKSCGVKIATENMWNWNAEQKHAAPASCSDPKSFCELLNAVNDVYFVACLDIGHAEMKGLNTSAVEMIYALKDKLQVLHIHDNDKLHDNHQIPYSMKIDFGPIIKALSDIGYDGDFSLEADEYLKKRNIVRSLIDMSNVVHKMTNEFDALRALSNGYLRVENRA